ncbi:MAG: sterol desaturase family protein [Flavobacteriia bacterium]|nr:sterol desaturase family protein [Flavobacteriia bacterium]
MDINPIVLSIPVFFGLILIELIVDLVTGKRSYRLGDAYGNISCGIFEQTTGVLAKIFTVGLYTWVYQFRIMDIERTWIYAIVLFLAVDFLYYWAHRISHETNLLWLGHVVHHQSEDYNLSVALRQGAVQKVFTSPFYLPLAFIGFAPDWFVYILAWNTLYQFWIHTEKIGKLGPLEWILNTPSHHRVHHGRNPKYIDKNHAATLIIWDRLFGTFQKEEERPTYGITKPVNSFNPLVAHFKPFQDLGKELKGLTLTESIRLLFAPPGWRPARLGGREFAPEVNGVRKYDPKINWPSTVITLIQFITVLGFVAFFLFSVNGLNTSQTWLGVGSIILTVFTLGFKANGEIPHLLLESSMIASITAWWILMGIPQVGIIIGVLLIILTLLSRIYKEPLRTGNAL